MKPPSTTKKQYACRACDKVFGSYGGRRNHEMRHHPGALPTGGPPPEEAHPVASLNTLPFHPVPGSMGHIRILVEQMRLVAQAWLDTAARVETL